MSATEPDDLQPRDKLLARLLAESLSPSATAGPALSNGTCPDAETMAAYADRTLTTEQAAELDTHFASCVRCQKVLAALAVSLEALPELPALATIPPLNIRTQTNIHRSGRSSHPSSTAAPSSAPVLPIRTTPRSQPTHWRQLAPALGIAAAVALWFALRPAPQPQTLSAQLEAQKEIPATQTPDAQNNSEIAEANIPAPAAPLRAPAPPSAATPPSPRESRQLSAHASQAGTLQSLAAPRDALKKTESAENSLTPATNPSPASPAAATEAEKQAQAKASAATPQAQAGQAGAFSAGAQAGAPAAAPAPPLAVGGTGGAGNASATATANAAARVQAFALKVAQVPVFASPSRAVMWRVGAAGSIERSADRGQTWEKQASGVLSDLVAGAATSNDAAWIVGRAGVILRTTDGAHWQRVSLPAVATNPATLQSETRNSTSTNSASPRAAAAGKVSPAAAPSEDSASAVASSRSASGTALDLSGVEANDALHATVVVAASGRRFTTSDGGQTWAAQ